MLSNTRKYLDENHGATCPQLQISPFLLQPAGVLLLFSDNQFQ